MKSPAHPAVAVVAAVIRNAQGEVLIAQRPPGKDWAGWWEFPGGKVGDGESERAALGRELAEELGIAVAAAQPWIRHRHEYPDRAIELSVWMVESFAGIPTGREGQQWRWCAPESLTGARMLPADGPIVRHLIDTLTRPARECGNLGNM